jgi:hypothetical protein
MRNAMRASFVSSGGDAMQPTSCIVLYRLLGLIKLFGYDDTTELYPRYAMIK